MNCCRAFFCVALLSLNFLKHLTEIPDCRVIVNVFISFLFSFFAGFIWVLRCSYDHAQLNFYLRAVLFGICLILRVPAPSSSLTCFLFSFFFVLRVTDPILLAVFFFLLLAVGLLGTEFHLIFALVISF